MDPATAVQLISNPPPLLLEELVLSVESPQDVAKRHNIPNEVFDLVYTHPIFVAKLNETKAHHEKTGEYHRTYVRYRFIEALDNAHFKAMDPRTSPKDATAYMEALAGIGGLKQSANQVEAAGGGFVFNIHLPGETTTVELKSEQVIEGEVVNETAELPVVNVTSAQAGDYADFEFTE